jgi:adenosylcobinamide kinase / adenosylcobinamide-phosphate guanylyltransferase
VLTELPAVILLDCLTLLVSNVLLGSLVSVDGDNSFDPKLVESQVQYEVDSLCQLLHERAVHVIVISGEVGMGIVPESKLGRVFRDLLGWANQSFASHADATYLMVAGRAINVDAIATDVSSAAHELAQRCTGHKVTP